MCLIYFYMIILIILFIYLYIWNLHSSVGLLTKLWARPVRIRGSFLGRVCSTPNFVSKVCRILIALEVKRPEREAHYSPPSDSEDENSLTFTSTFPFVFWRRAESHKDIFTSWFIYLAFYIYWFMMRKLIRPGQLSQQFDQATAGTDLNSKPDKGNRFSVNPSRPAVRRCFWTAGPRPGTVALTSIIPGRERFSWNLSF